MPEKDLRRAYFLKCLGCGLRFPALERVGLCPACGGKLRLEAERKVFSDRDGLLLPLDTPCVAVLENLRSAWNVGSIFRTAEAAGFSRLYLCGITPAPPHPGVKKTALGAEETVPWSRHPDALEVVEELLARGFYLLALEETPEAEPWHPDLELPAAPLALVVGNELCGVDPGVLERANSVLAIPMRGRKRSLNVAVAFGVVALWISARRAIPR